MVLFAVILLLAFPRAAQADVTYSTDEIAIVNLINQYRVANGLDALLVSDVVSDASKKHSHDMATYDFFNHYTVASDWFPVGASWNDRMVACGYPQYRATGENLVAGTLYETPQSALDAWKQSYGHNLNMLDSRWKVIGVGVLDLPGSEWGKYWTTDFGDYVDGSAHANGSTLEPDTAAPAVAILQPSPAGEVRGSVTVYVDANDNRRVTRVDLYVNGSFIASDTDAPYAIVWNSSVAGNGWATLEARAYDPSGNVGSATCRVMVTGSVDTTSTTSTTTTSTTTTSTTTSTTTTSTTSTTTPGGTTTTTTERTATFSDVPPTYIYYQPITALASVGIISGYAGDLFHPASAVTRAQFAKIIVLALGKHTAAIDNGEKPSFADVRYTGNAYPFDYVEEASALGIMSGYANKTFGPDKSVTRLQLAVMIVRAGGAELATPPSGYSCSFKDVPAYAREAVTVALFNGIASGKTAKTFDPYGSATRGQVAKMVYALCKLLHKLQ